MSGQPELEFHLPDAPWRRPEGAAEGVWEQTLAQGASSLTLLQRYEPGTDTSGAGVISHDFVEEVYLVNGDLTDLTLGLTFTAGMYASRPPGMPHGPYTSDAGCLMLVTHRPA